MTTPCEVVIPCRNAPEVLWLTLTHLWAHADWEGIQAVTLIDNRSTAPGMEDVLQWARRQGCLVVRNEQNVGVWASVNRGLALARSPRIFVLTSDVLLGPHAIRVLSEVMDQAPEELVHLGPWVIEGPEALRGLPLLGNMPQTVRVDASRYNGAAWLMRWDVLRERIGWFNPDYYVAYGDTSYVERVRQAGLMCGVVPELLCIHLDKQTRRADHTVEQDTEVEMRDGARFREEWADDPDVLARHPAVDEEKFLFLKRGWKEMQIR